MEATNSNQHTRCIVCNSPELATLSNYEKHNMVKCAKCGMVFMKLIPTLEELNNHYKNYSYDREVYVSPVTIKRYNELLDEFEKYKLTGNMLDVGCGVGLFLNVAKQRGWNVYGTEYSDKAVEICTAKGIEMKKGKLNAKAFDIPFDIITSFEVIEHINNPNEELDNINALLRKGGLFYCTTPNFNALARFYVKADYNVISYPEHLSYYTPSTIKYLGKKHGLKALRVATTGISITRIINSKPSPKTVSTEQKTASPNVGSETADEKLRQTFENNKLASIAKSMANWLFTVTGTGSALKAYFVKP